MAKLEKIKKHLHDGCGRGWGREIWIENREEYCGKLLLISENKKSSLHFHMEKMETMFLQSGAINIMMIDPRTGKNYVVELFPGDSLFIPPGQVHQICAIKDSELFEFSTTHFEDDSYRVEKGD